MKELKEILYEKKVIVFDLDGTIIKLKVNWSDLRRILSERYFTLYGEKNDFKTVTECFNKIIDRKDEVELLRFFQIVQDYELKSIKNNELIEETAYFINNLEKFGVKQNTHLAILSLNMRETIIKSLTLVNLNEKFNYILGKENVRNWKPHPEGLLKIQDHFAESSENMIYFGDLKKDIQTGINAGIDAFFIEELIDLVNEKRS
ncbi:MAG: HAD family hydrolase [Promethearchaeota archaeon]